MTVDNGLSRPLAHHFVISLAAEHFRCSIHDAKFSLPFLLSPLGHFIILTLKLFLPFLDDKQPDSPTHGCCWSSASVLNSLPPPTYQLHFQAQHPFPHAPLFLLFFDRDFSDPSCISFSHFHFILQVPTLLVVVGTNDAFQVLLSYVHQQTLQL